MAASIEKSETAKREEQVLSYWKEKGIFEKTLAKPSPSGDFVFYDGPPFATGLPHMGHLLSSTIKDAIPRYKTMRGFSVRRRWGWDTHGLPIESLVEKKLGLKSKKDIEALGIDTFNEAARSMVLEYVHDWEQYVDRIGRWVDFKNSYKTMDNSYIESVWWGLAEANKKGFLYEGRKVLMYCPHCETPLAKAEIAMDNSYQDITEESVTVKFKVKDPSTHGFPQNTYILAWTTTPWTLPGNVALAVGPDITYALVQAGEEYYVLAKDRVPSVFAEGSVTEVKTFLGSQWTGIAYEPLFPIEKVKNAGKQKTWTVLPADFVTTTDGTGVVHTAVIYGEDDYQLGVKEDLPMVPLLNPSGRFTDDAPERIRGKYFKHHKNGFPQAGKGEDAEHFIKHDLEARGLLFAKEQFTHSYPHCYRCGTPLIYNAITSWFLKINPEVKERMITHNQSVNWYPEHLKEGRFLNIVENAPDWTISRNRFWASPLPIWKNEKTGVVTVMGTIDELKAHTKRSGNRYFVMRHGEAKSNVDGILDRKGNPANILTPKGEDEVKSAASKLQDAKVARIVASPLIRTRMSAEILAHALNVPIENVHYDNRLLENDFGAFDGKKIDEYHASFPQLRDKMTLTPVGGENWHDAKKRMAEVLYELEQKYQNEAVVILSHSGPLQMLLAGSLGMNDDEAGMAIEDGRFSMQNGEVRELPFVPLPHNAEYELDLHRPYIDALPVVDEAGERLVRTLEVVDCWVESGSMPFAELHYLGAGSPAEAEFTKRFPGDYIAEYIAQTRTWFYYMHALGSLLFDSPAFKNVVSTGTILAGDGSKMSKSKGNYTDPLENLDRYGADALRLYLLGSVVMQSEDMNFRDEELRDVHNRIINILFNTFKFYSMYQGSYDATVSATNSPNVLDQWVLARLAKLIGEVTGEMDRYDTVRAVRAASLFVDDFSTWYVRRSRDRVKSEGDDRRYALSTMRHVLVELAKVIAPLAPFVAESIYQGVSGGKESVHLEDWPATGEDNSPLLGQMEHIRELVSVALQKRSAAGIKVRQPLATLTVSAKFREIPEGLWQLVRDELNVKTIAFSEGLAEADADLDTTISPELQEEGDMRELLRHVQELRKQGGLSPADAAVLHIDTSEALKAVVERHRDKLTKPAGLAAIAYETIESDAVSIGEFTAKLSVTRA